jgi:hypothetical protein
MAAFSQGMFNEQLHGIRMLGYQQALRAIHVSPDRFPPPLRVPASGHVIEAFRRDIRWQQQVNSTSPPKFAAERALALQSKLHASSEFALRHGGSEGVRYAATRADLLSPNEKSDIARGFDTHRAESERIVRDAKELSASVIWVSERDACLTCLALAGSVESAGNEFNTQATFDVGHPMSFPQGMLLLGPPRHPHCRCHLRIWFGTKPSLNPTAHNPEATLADALQREARRVVALQQSPHASNPARMRAATLLLAEGAALPKTVEARGRSMLRKGRDHG